MFCIIFQFTGSSVQNANYDRHIGAADGHGNNLNVDKSLRASLSMVRFPFEIAELYIAKPGTIAMCAYAFDSADGSWAAVGDELYLEALVPKVRVILGNLYFGL